MVLMVILLDTQLQDGQGCIASPKHNWVGVYWLSVTLLYTASFALALKRSFQSLKIKPVTYWKLMLRDGLNLYGAIWAVNMVNMIFWFVMPPHPDNAHDPIKTIVTRRVFSSNARSHHFLYCT